MDETDEINDLIKDAMGAKKKGRKPRREVREGEDADKADSRKGPAPGSGAKSGGPTKPPPPRGPGLPILF